MKIAIYPGSFDPFTYGHENIIERSVKVFDQIIVAVAHNTSKKTIFTVAERVEILNEVFKNRDDVKVDYFEGLLVEYIKKMGTNVVLRGMRTVSDFEFEMQMALANKTLSSELETVFMVTDSEFSHISSSVIKEVVSLNGSASHMVPEIVETRLREKLLRS
ncbi:MAG: pantetheine-phosphate adenylyltransferase [Candidatus Dadabacteria bacterium]|nr:MAG: pantetheine-phosphate adenylyltransferase [Candidatus Dadabacteria bacterium]TDJ02766.1 MAG: pantetheine-phosphate adenylyltransferase [Candidatus Dadabacteria bacterium]